MALGNGSNLGFEERLWTAADKLRGTMDASEYKHVVLGLIFLKYISDSFEEFHTRLTTQAFADPEDRDEYIAENVFWVPVSARWPYLMSKAKDPKIGVIIDDAMTAIETENPRLKGVLSKDYARPALDKFRLGQLIDLISTIGLGDAESRSKDILGRVYEYFLGKFAASEGKGGGEFYTPQCVVRLLVEMLEPFSRAASMTPAAAAAACSCKQRNSSRRTPQATATAGTPMRISPFTGRNPTTPPGSCAR